MATLGLLIKRPGYINELPRLLGRHFGEQVKISSATVTRLLGDLQEAGHVEICSEDRVRDIATTVRRHPAGAPTTSGSAVSSGDDPLDWEILIPFIATNDRIGMLETLNWMERGA